MAVQSAIILSIRSDNDGMRILRETAQAYKVDFDVMSRDTRKEFAEKEKEESTQAPTKRAHPTPNGEPKTAVSSLTPRRLLGIAELAHRGRLRNNGGLTMTSIVAESQT